ncbi:MAG: DUF4282 domain-containing protein [Clostridia bacterium]|nr:DUF4282 domain-containing protein [Clostridia bacterium]
MYSLISALPAIITVLTLLLAVGGTIVACILIVPEKRRNTLPTFFKVLHDIFNFKQLLIEKILKVAYIFSTVALIVYGFLTLVSSPAYFSFSPSYTTSKAISGLLTMILGPIILRLVYEFLMMIILLVKNVIEINSKLKGSSEAPNKNSTDASPNNSAKHHTPERPASHQNPILPRSQNQAQPSHRPGSFAMYDQQTPVQQVPARKVPAQQTPIQQTPVQQIPDQQTFDQQVTEMHIPDQQTPAKQTPVKQATAEQEEKWVFCTACGVKYDKNKGACHNCGHHS